MTTGRKQAVAAEPSVGDLISGAGTSIGIPLIAGIAGKASMPGQWKEIDNPQSRGWAGASNKLELYKPVAEATERVNAGKGSMLDHMQAYKHPNQPQANPAYAAINHFGPKMLNGTTEGIGKWLGNGIGQGAGLGALGGAGAGILWNSIMALLGRRKFSPLKSGLGGAAAGAVIGGGGAAYRDWRSGNPIKLAAWRSPDMDQGRAQADTQNILSMIRQAPGLSFNQRSQLMFGVGRLDSSSISELRRTLGMGGGAVVGAIVARFLMGKGMGATVVGALIGGALGNAVFGQGPTTYAGAPGLVGRDLS